MYHHFYQINFIFVYFILKPAVLEEGSMVIKEESMVIEEGFVVIEEGSMEEFMVIEEPMVTLELNLLIMRFGNLVANVLKIHLNFVSIISISDILHQFSGMVMYLEDRLNHCS